MGKMLGVETTPSKNGTQPYSPKGFSHYRM